jgi:hypothetical protein
VSTILQGRSDVTLDEMPAMRTGVGFPNDHVRMDLGPVALEADVTIERQHFHLLVDGILRR